jgi:hypothetical protein
MITLEFNPNIRSKKTYKVPINLGEALYDKRKLFSYSIYEDNIIREFIFGENRVLKYIFDDTGFLRQIEKYSENGNQEYSTSFELLEKENQNIRFREYFRRSQAGNHGHLQFNQETKSFSLTFHRVNSYFGYKVEAIYLGNDLSLAIEEQYYKCETERPILENILLNTYEMKINSLDHLVSKIISDGWSLNQSDRQMLDNY